MLLLFDDRAFSRSKTSTPLRFSSGVSRPALTSWERYWRLVHTSDRSIRSPIDVFVDRLAVRAHGRWLDAGCGRQSLPEWRSEELQRVLAGGVVLFGCDADLLALTERRDPGSVCGATLDELPFRDASFDFVSANMVFEHLVKPQTTVRELARVTRPGGRILVHTVNGLHYLSWMARLTPYRFHQWIVERVEGRAGKDVYPTQYRANTVGRLRRLFEDSGCRFVDGGLVDGIPLYLPYRGLFHVAIRVGLLECRLARLPGLSNFLRPNLLMEFERICAETPGGCNNLRGIPTTARTD
jgi:ubiquinone/menaquinone biosynthesis C-methylase UbiE